MKWYAFYIITISTQSRSKKMLNRKHCFGGLCSLSVNHLNIAGTTEC